LLLSQETDEYAQFSDHVRNVDHGIGGSIRIVIQRTPQVSPILSLLAADPMILAFLVGQEFSVARIPRVAYVAPLAVNAHRFLARQRCAEKVAGAVAD